MGAALSLCIVDDSWEPEEVFIQKILKRYLDNGEAKLSLAIASMPDEIITPSRRNLWAAGNRIAEVFVETLQVAKGWAPLRWRYGGQAALANSPGQDRALSAGQGPTQRFWRAKVITVLTNGEEKSQWCLLQVSTEPQQRSMENAMLDRKDAEKVANFAHSFNQLLARDEASMFGEVPGICVCMPQICKVLQSPVPQFFARGDAVQLLPYSSSEVTKFVFDGHEDFLEVPQAFFHYVTWSSGGHECVCDLQGVEEDNGAVTITNPLLPRPAPLSAGSLFSDPKKQGISDKNTVVWPAAPSPQMFDKVHPRCGPLCKSFDPDRRAKPARKACGLPVACGFNAPTCENRTRGPPCQNPPAFTIL